MHASAIVRVPFCGLPCPPLRIETTGGGAWSVAGGCRQARAAAGWTTDPGGPRLEGRPAGPAEAIDRAVAILATACRPVVGGLGWSTVGTARRAVRIAGRMGALVDIEGGGGAAAESEAIAAFGMVSATFGAVRDRADVVLLWRCDPRAEHPDLLPARLPAEGGGVQRRVLRLGGAGAGGPGDLEALATLRALALGRAPHLTGAPPGARAGGIEIALLRDAAAALRAARHAAILWEAAAVEGPAGPAMAMALILLARDLNDDVRRAVARPLGAGGNVAGAFAALLSERGHARDLDDAGGADVALLVGARHRPAGWTDGGPPARVVVIGPRLPDGIEAPDVHLPAAVPGLSGGGLWMRADGIAVPVREVTPPAAPTEEEILDGILARLPDEPRIAGAAPCAEAAPGAGAAPGAPPAPGAGGVR